MRILFIILNFVLLFGKYFGCEPYFPAYPSFNPPGQNNSLLPAINDSAYQYVYINLCWTNNGDDCPVPTRPLVFCAPDDTEGGVCWCDDPVPIRCEYDISEGYSDKMDDEGHQVREDWVRSIASAYVFPQYLFLNFDRTCDGGTFGYLYPSENEYDTLLPSNEISAPVNDLICRLWGVEKIRIHRDFMRLRNLDCGAQLPLNGPYHEIILKEDIDYGLGLAAGLTNVNRISVGGEEEATEVYEVPYVESHGVTIKEGVRLDTVFLTGPSDGSCRYFHSEVGTSVPKPQLHMDGYLWFDDYCLSIKNLDFEDIAISAAQSIESAYNFRIRNSLRRALQIGHSQKFSIDDYNNIWLYGQITDGNFGISGETNFLQGLWVKQVGVAEIESPDSHSSFHLGNLGSKYNLAEINKIELLNSVHADLGESYLSVEALKLSSTNFINGGNNAKIKNINGNGNSNAEIREFKVGRGGTDVREFNKLIIGSDKFTAQGNIRFRDIDEIEIRETSSTLQLTGRLWQGDYSKVLDVEAEIIEEGDEEYVALSSNKQLLRNYTITQKNEGGAMVNYKITHGGGEMSFDNVRKLTIYKAITPTGNRYYKPKPKKIEKEPTFACLNPATSPVYAKDGAYFLDEIDVQANTRERELHFRRYYASNNPSFSQLGAKWMVADQYRLFHFGEEESERLELYWGLGNSTALLPVGDNVYRSEDDKYTVYFTDGAASVSVTRNDATTFTFVNREVPDSLIADNYVLQRISGREKFDLFYEYDTANRLLRMAEVTKGADSIGSSDPALEFSYNGQGLLYSVSVNGRNIHYFEYDQGRLTAISTSDGVKVRYLYDNENYPYHITGVFAPGGERMATVEYDDFGKVHSYSSPEEEAVLQYNEVGEVMASVKTRAGLSEETRVTFSDDIKVDTKERTADGQTIRTKYLWEGEHNIGVINAENIISVRSFGPDGMVTAEKLLSEPYHDGMTTADLSSAALWAQTGLDTFYEYEYCQGLPVIKSIRRQMTNESDERLENYTYNADCRLLTRRLGDGGSHIVYNEQGRVFQEWQEEYEEDTVVGSFLLREISYDQYGFVASIKTGHGNANGQYTVTQVNDQWGNVLQRIDERGVIHTFEYDNNNRITKSRITNPDNAAEYVETSYSYDHAGRLKRIDRPGRAYTEMGYDAHNRLLYTVDQFERVTSFVYDSAERLVKRIEPTGNIIRHEYNAFGNLIQTSDETGSTEQYSFDKLFRMSSQTDADGYFTSTAYDQYGRLRERNTHLNEETTLSEQYQHDAWGLRTTDSDYRGFTRNYAYDNRQRLSEQTAYGFNAALHYTRQSEYDILDRPTSIDINGRENIFANDYTQSEFTSTDPLNRQVKNVLDAAGNVLSTIDPSGAVRSYEYDYLSRLKKKTRPDGVNTSYEYNERLNLSVERVKTATGALLLLHEHEYDNGDRRVKTTITDYTTDKSVELNYSYDRGNRLLKVHELPADTEIRYTYDKASRISTVTIPAQHRELRYVYDGRGNKVNIYIRDTQNNRFTMQAFEYDALNRLTYAYSEYYGEVQIEYFDGEFTSTEELRRRVTYPSGIKAEFYHDAFDRPVRIAWLKDDSQIMAHSYEYDSFDRIIRKTVDSPSGQRQENYSFDLADRLIAALTPEGTINYDYDQNDNLTSIYHSGNIERQVNFATDGQYQELLTGASYPAFGRSFTFGLDALGRRITDQNISNNALHVRTYAFDPMSRLSAVSSVKAPLPNAEPWPAEELEYSYLPGSPLRRNLTKQQPAQTTKRHFIWDGANELESLSEFQEGGNTDYFAEIFLSDPAIMDKRFGAAKNLNAFVNEAAEGIDYITDQQNTINASYKDGNVTDEQHFSPYGQPVTFTLPEDTELTKFAYTGRNYDAPADLYYYRGRYYDACSARFLNPDPVENRLNWLNYVGGDPVNMVDPTGYVDLYLGSDVPSLTYEQLSAEISMIVANINNWLKNHNNNPCIPQATKDDFTKLAKYLDVENKEYLMSVRRKNPPSFFMSFFIGPQFGESNPNRMTDSNPKKSKEQPEIFEVYDLAWEPTYVGDVPGFSETNIVHEFGHVLFKRTGHSKRKKWNVWPVGWSGKGVNKNLDLITPGSTVSAVDEMAAYYYKYMSGRYNEK